MFKWKPSKTAAREFAKKMTEVETFCNQNGIRHSSSWDSFYFSLNGINYRISNHTIERSNAKAFDKFGEKIREFYHEEDRLPDVVYIHASKTRIIEIFNNLKAGKKLNGKGQEI